MDKILGYQLIELVSKSQNTEIYRAIDSDKKSVVLKLLRDDNIDSEKLAHFKKEYEITSKLTSNWIVKPYDLLKYKDTLVMVLEDFGGISLNQFIAKYSPCTNTTQLIEILNVAILITKALNDIHNQNIIHKDINPSNIIINKEKTILKIIDFGLATKLVNEQFEPLNETKFEGTYAYISPEQTGRFNRIIDYKTDYYSLGITFYELFSGRLPYNASTPREWIHSHIAKEPLALNILNPNVPVELSKIVNKLMNKTADYRYQSGFGILCDLEKCLTDLQSFGKIAEFPVGRYDVSQKFQIPQKLYGRENEIANLLSFYNEVKNNHRSLVLVNGYPGIGKTSIIKELQKPIIESKGYFVSGKFDQLKKNIPYNAFIQAISQLLRAILSEGSDEIQSWKTKILNHLNGNGKLITNVIPELEFIIGKQADLPSLPASESHNRFFSTFLNFIKTFTSKKHPLVIFLDDLHWADMASLDMIESLLSHNHTGSLLIIGAYIDSEIKTEHPLLISIERIQNSESKFHNIHIDNLEHNAIQELLIDAFSFTNEISDYLTKVCLSKTNGNPFFIIEFLKSLYQAELLQFNNISGAWDLDTKHIEKSEVAENVADLISKRLDNLSEDIRNILKYAACIGSKFNAYLIYNASKNTWKTTINLLNEASEKSIIYPVSSQYRYAEYNTSTEVSYKFVHDRIQQEVYDSIPDEEKREIHQEIGRFLLKSLTELHQDEKLYSVLEHLNKGIEFIKDDEKVFLADLNLKACKKSKQEGAYENSLYFAKTSLELINSSIWKSNYKLALQIHIEATESLSLCAAFDEMEMTINYSLEKITCNLDKAKLIEIRILSYIAQYRQSDAVAEAIKLLESLGTKFPKKPLTLHIVLNLIKINGKLKKLKYKNILDLEPMQDQVILVSMNIMAKILSASYYVDAKLFPLIVFKLIQYTLKHGIAPKSPVAFITFGLLNYTLGKTDQGYLHSQTGMNMFSKLEADEHWSQAACIHNSAVVWKEALKNSINGLFNAFKKGVDTGDIEFAVASVAAGLCYKLYGGYDIRELYYETEKYKTSLYYLNQNVPFNQIKSLLQTIHNFIEGSKNPEILNGTFYNESEMTPHFQEMKDNASALDLYLKKMVLAYHFNSFYKAQEIVSEARKIVNDVAGLLLYSQFHYYESLILLSCISDFNKQEYKTAKNRILSNQKKLKKWASDCPANFENKYLLIEAELERLNGNITQARENYDIAITLSQQEGNLMDQALGNELAGQFWIQNKKPEFAKIYLEKAFKLYNIWGATAKADALLSKYNKILLSDENMGIRSLSSDSKSSTGTSKISQTLDLESILDSAKAISSEIIFTELVKKILTIILEHAGAQKGFLLINDSNEQLQIEAQGIIENNEIIIKLERKALLSNTIPKSLIHYVERTKETIILHNACSEGDFINDEYFKQNAIKSVIIVPILHQSKFSGLLYLENNLSTHVFNQKRVDILSILCTQAAISIENAQLYNSLEQKVEDRTIEISEKNRLLEYQKEKIEKAHDELKDLNTTKDKFFSIIAHDLRGPLANINMFFDLLSKKVISNDQNQIDDFIQRFKETSKNTYDLLNNLLIWAQSQRNEILYNPTQANIKKVIDSNLSLIEQKASEKGVSLKNKITSDFSAYFDVNIIDTVTRNIINNALKYTNKNDSITISLSESNESVIISINDTGIGMNKNIMDHIFNLEGKASSRKGTNDEKGTGLGLILCKEFIEKNGGNIWVESQENVGSTFSFSIPKQSYN
ncbi:MAG: AAA family ATPase [Salinivirgaceae bacterium]|nr:AAA family ATPase [Salinivirgaceae bacterium]